MSEEAGGALVVFALGGEEFALPVSEVREVVPFSDATRVPRAAPEVVGLMNVRGRVVPVLDLARLLALPAKSPPVARQVMVHEAPGAIPLGLLVDEVRDVVRVLPGAIEPPPSLVGKAPIAGIVRLGARLVAVCDLGALVPRGGA